MNLIAESAPVRGSWRAAARCAVTVLLVASACHAPDPRSVEGALDAAARAIEANDAERLFRVVDERGRHALASIVADRRRAATVVRDTYPGDEAQAVLRSLGDGAEAEDAAALFAGRCMEACMGELAARIGAPTRREERGDEVIVHTSRDTTLRMHLGTDGWWGIVWRTEQLARERDRAAQELRQIRNNADIYRRRRALESK